MKRLILSSIMVLAANSAFAECGMNASRCFKKDGSTYELQQNLGGGYAVSRDGKSEGRLSQNLSGSWTLYRPDGRRKRSTESHRPFRNTEACRARGCSGLSITTDYKPKS